VLTSPGEVIHIEIERNLADLQAQLRSGMLKRDDIARRYPVPVRFVLAIPDTTRLRRMLDGQAQLVSTVLPRTPRDVFVALRSGKPLGGYGVVWIRDRDGRRHGAHRRTR
jgi:hypothetical protein